MAIPLLPFSFLPRLLFLHPASLAQSFLPINSQEGPAAYRSSLPMFFYENVMQYGSGMLQWNNFFIISF
jgi:hypothetical protein